MILSLQIYVLNSWRKMKYEKGVWDEEGDGNY